MGKILEKLTDKLIEFVKQQKMFFVGTSPTTEGEDLLNFSIQK